MYIVIQRDDDPFNPREGDNFGTMAMRARERFGMAEEAIYDKDVFLLSAIEDLNPEFVEGLEHAESEMMAGMDFDAACQWEERRQEAVATEFERLFIAVPIYVYEHSGVALSTKPFTCYWDSGQVGLNYVSRAKAEEELGSIRYPLSYPKGIHIKDVEEHALFILEAEVKLVHQYINGEVYGYTVYDDNDQYVDSCWGFYSDDWGQDWDTNGMADNWPDYADKLPIYLNHDDWSPLELLREGHQSTLESPTNTGEENVQQLQG